MGDMLDRTDNNNQLGRFYTRDHIGTLLIAQLDHRAPSRIVDLGAGEGSLARAARHRWASAEIFTVDVDNSASKRLTSYFAKVSPAAHKHLCADALRRDLPDLLRSQGGPIDVAICNPPFVTPEWRRGFGEILEEAGFSACLPVLHEADAALLFLAQNLRVLEHGGTIGIVLPDSLISAKRYRPFRETLLSKYSLLKTVRLPRRSFLRTDALAFIAVLGKRGPTVGQVQVQSFDVVSGLSFSRNISIDQAIDRLDFVYHDQQPITEGSVVPLGSICTRVARGSLTTTQRLESKHPVTHLTDLGLHAGGTRIALPYVAAASNLICATGGDILLARVGRNLEEKVYLVSAGSCPITDCIYAITVQKKYRSTAFAQLRSERGRKWLASRAYGVSAKQLTKADLLSFPIQLEKTGR